LREAALRRRVNVILRPVDMSSSIGTQRPWRGDRYELKEFRV
jgi:hypothetical protein